MKILIVDFLATGDLIISTGAIRMIRKAFPGAEITLFALYNSAQAILKNTDIDKIVSCKKEIFFGRNRYFNVLKNVIIWRKIKYDLVVSFHVGRQPNLIVDCIRAKNKIIPGRNKLKHIVSKDYASYARGLNEYIDVYPNIAQEAIRLYGIEHSHIERTVLILSEEEKKNIRGILHRIGINKKEFLAVFPGGGISNDYIDLARRFPKIYEALYCFYLHQPKVPVILLGSDTDNTVCRKIMHNKPINAQWFDYHGKTTFREYMGLIEASALLVTNDSSALHIATAFDIPTIAIFGPTDPKEKVDPRANIKVIAPTNPSFTYTGRFSGLIDDAIRTFDEISPDIVGDTISLLWPKQQ